MERDKKKEDLTSLWLGTNLQYKGLQEIIGNMKGQKELKQEEAPEKVVNEWKRLQKFMAGRTN